MLRGMFEGAAHIGREGNCLPIFLITLHRSIAQTKSESGIRRLAEPALCKARFGDDRAITADHRVHLILELFSRRSGRWINRAHGHD